MAIKKKVILRPLIEEPSVLILHEKHGTLHFHIPDEETLMKVALDILEKRLDSNYWYYDPRGDKPVDPKISREEAEALKEGALKDMALGKVRAYEEALRRWRDDVVRYDELKLAVKEKDGRLAWRLLQIGNGEYARVSLEGYLDEYPEQK